MPPRLGARAANKAALQARLGPGRDPDALLVGVISRLTWQKGIDLLLSALPALLGGGCQLALLGAGEPRLESTLAAAADPSRAASAYGSATTRLWRI